MLKTILALAASICVALATAPAFAQPGCCSYHEGVKECDLESGYLRCWDGTLSETCTCVETRFVEAKYMPGGDLKLTYGMRTPEPGTWRTVLVLLEVYPYVLPMWEIPFPAFPDYQEIPLRFPFPTIGTFLIWSQLETAMPVMGTSFDFAMIEAY